MSDVAGLCVLAIFLSVIFSNKILAYITAAVLFVAWKCPIADYPIAFWNSLNIFQIGRVIDYTDYFALLVLPLSYIYKPVAPKLNLTISLGFDRLFL
ncbi:hypothetical protein [Pedobacter sp. UYP30]|uniref:hypothetical protein n=1 Tax=Pedobacter sp. UYP30 TaxID=1756400 RepID=UPI0033981317